MSYLRMSASDTLRLANFIDSSKCSLRISGTGSTSSPSSIASSPLASRSLCMRIVFSMLSLMAYLHERWQISVRSAPENLAVALASSSISTSLATGDLRRQDLRMSRREAWSGRGMYTSWSRRPGRMRAGSMMSGRLVAPMMKTFFFSPTPSISVSIWFITRSPAPPASPPELPRARAIESSSSKKSTQGADCLALSKISLTLLSDSPNHMVSSSGPLIEMKLDWHSLAIAFASSVLPHPGGP
mmetsp:Transcript_37639/g.73535  ORF Transcript_37639/g.73535 Transcript_37639/m.73535 type:complete len:243 (+) Transcript_37639:349-1077(+)